VSDFYCNIFILCKIWFVVRTQFSVNGILVFCVFCKVYLQVSSFMLWDFRAQQESRRSSWHQVCDFFMLIWFWIPAIYKWVHFITQKTKFLHTREKQEVWLICVHVTLLGFLLFLEHNSRPNSPAHQWVWPRTIFDVPRSQTGPSPQMTLLVLMVLGANLVMHDNCLHCWWCYVYN
jgi:hypothetical protein